MPSTSAAATRLLLFSEDRPSSGPHAPKVRRYRMARLALDDGGRRSGEPKRADIRARTTS